MGCYKQINKKRKYLERAGKERLLEREEEEEEGVEVRRRGLNLREEEGVKRDVCAIVS